jgi:hypothetical protein
LQIKYNDSLKKILSFATKPIERFDIINKILQAQVGNVDSASAIELLQIAQEQKNDSLLAISYNWIGSYFAFNKGDNTQAGAGLLTCDCSLLICSNNNNRVFLKGNVNW